MRQKCAYLILLILLLPNGLAAQNSSKDVSQDAPQDAPPNTLKKVANTYTEPRFKVVLGIGLDLAYTVLTEEGRDLYENLNDQGFQKQAFFSVGGRVPIVMTFRIAEPYWMGFGAYFSFTYQAIQLKMLEEAPEKGIQTITYERGAINMAPVFYNEFVLNRTFSLNVAVGPSFTLSFGDKSEKAKNGIAITDPFTTLERKDSLQFTAGLLADLGFQIRFSHVVGMNLSAYLLMYFTPQKTAFDEDTWNPEPTYMGLVGGSITLLFFL